MRTLISSFLLVLAVSTSFVPCVVAASTTSGSGHQQSYGNEPKVLGAHTERVGERIADLSFTDSSGKSGRLSDVMGKKGLVLVIRDGECPLCLRYGPRIARLEDQVAKAGMGLLYVSIEDEAGAKADLERHELEGRCAVDVDGEIRRALAATTTTETFVLDAASTLQYRGMLDDQYGLGFARKAPIHEHLVDAISAVAAGGAPVVRATEAHGCKLTTPVGKTPKAEATYHGSVSRILTERCEACHRSGGAGPFSLSSYDDARKRTDMISFVLEEEIMPPWFADEGSGPWLNDAGLSDDERSTLLRWIRDEAPLGDEALAALPRKYVAGWTIGEPDLVVTSQEFEVPAEGVIDYQHFTVETGLTEDKWVQAVEIQAGATQVVHHVLVFLRMPGQPMRDGLRGFFASAVPGQSGLTFPLGMAKKLPKNARLTFQMHYTPNGIKQKDQTSIAFIFTDKPVKTEIRTDSAFATNFMIPPGESFHEVSSRFLFKQDSSILHLFPHTHLRGVGFAFEIETPDGDRYPILDMPNYDFNWQLNYQFAEPHQVLKGSSLIATGWYDNSSDNPNNPNPNIPVRFGEQTFEEMMVGYLNWVPTAELAPQ